MSINDEMNILRELINSELDKLFINENSYNKTIYEAMRYSLLSGGKRIRPILLIKSCELTGGTIKEAMPFALAIEMIHTYSLIHDDLPAMDDDCLRRGMPSNHIVFGEGIAILAGDGLLNTAYEMIIKHMIQLNKKGNISEKYLMVFHEICKGAGVNGMIGGQVVDILSDEKVIDIDTLKYMYKHKTSSLIIASILAGGILGGATDEEIDSLRQYGEAIGMMFQIRDDMLDIDSDECKITYLNFYSIEEAKEELIKLGDIAINALKSFDNEKVDFFKNFVYYLISRNK